MKIGTFTSNDFFICKKILLQFSKKQTISKYFQYVTAIRSIRGSKGKSIAMKYLRFDLQQNLEFYENS